LWACAIAAAAQAPEVNQDSLVIKDFNRRVADYMKMHKTVQSDIHRLKPTDSPEAIERHEHHLAHRIREERPGAVQGNIFTPEIATEFRRLIGLTMQGPEAVRIRQSLQRAAPVHSRAIRVNHPYPAGLPLQSVPPSLLLNLPPLPPDIEYRVVGRDLILRDIDANFVVDAISNVIS
jgi:hypothetical protein